MITIDHFMEYFSDTFKHLPQSEPWTITSNLKTIIEKMILNLDDDFVIENNIAIHKSAIIENNVTIKSPFCLMVARIATKKYIVF